MKTPLHDELQALREEEAHAQETQWQALFDATPLGVYLVDADFRFRQVNPTARPVFGDIPDLIGRDFDEVIHLLWPKDYADEFVRLFRHTLETGEPYFRPEHIEARLDRGVTESYEWQIHRIPLSHARPDKRFGVVCYFRDISAQVFTSQQIIASEAKYRTLFDSIDEGFCLIEMIFDDAGQPIDYRFIETNAVFGSQTGLEKVTGKTALELIPNLEKWWIETYGRVALTGESVRFENYSAPMKRWFDVYAARIGGDTNRLVAIVFRDITKSRQAEERLRESEERFSKAFNASPLALTISSLTTGKLIEVNDTFVNVTGYTRAEALGKTTLELGLWKRSSDREAEMEEVRQVGQLSHVEYTFQLRSGQEIIGLLAAEKIEIAGEPCALTVIQDITERKQLEAERERLLVEEQEARARAEAATRAKDEFLAVVSHELRSPLNAILGYTRLLRTQRKNDPEITQITSIIERNGRAQIQLIEDLLDTARIISGKLKLEIGPVELTEVIAAALDTVRPAAERKTIALNITFEAEADAYQITGDANRLQQVVWNLLSNAIKFTPEGGQIRITLHRLASAVQIVVSDTGHGISPDLLPFVFDRFRQGDSSSTRRFGGLGLGLALVKHLVELHGGEVKVQSAGEAQGATFTIHLPLRNADFGVQISEASGTSNSTKANRSAFYNPHSAMLQGLRVLVVDDEQAARELVALTLHDYGAFALTVGSPNAAMAALEDAAHDAPFDLLLSDIGMPGEDGYSLIGRVRTHPNAQVREIRAVALTAYARSEDRLKALAAGFQMHISKPVEEGELTMVVASVTGRL